jgi:hypothetical protein
MWEEASVLDHIEPMFLLPYSIHLHAFKIESYVIYLSVSFLVTLASRMWLGRLRLALLS